MNFVLSSRILTKVIAFPISESLVRPTKVLPAVPHKPGSIKSTFTPRAEKMVTFFSPGI